MWYSVLSMVWHRLESIVNGWSDRELAYCAFCFDLDVPCCLLNTVVIVCSVTWLCASLCMRVTTIFLIGVLFKRIAPRQHMFLHWTSIAETCKTWQQMASSTMRDSTEHDSLAHIVNLFCQKKKEKRREKKNPPARLKWNGLISKMPELSESCEIVFADLSLSCIMEPRSNSVRYTLKKILYTIHFLDISIVLVHPCGALFYLWFMLHLSTEKHSKLSLNVKTFLSGTN